MRNALGNKTEITIRDIDDFYCSFSPDIPFSTVKWRIHSLIDKGILHRIGHGRYRFGEEKIFFPDIFRKTMDIARIMRKQFPFADYCQWNFSAVNAFVHPTNTLKPSSAATSTRNLHIMTVALLCAT